MPSSGGSPLAYPGYPPSDGCRGETIGFRERSTTVFNGTRQSDGHRCAKPKRDFRILTRPGPFQDGYHFPVAALDRMGKWRHPAAVRKVNVGAGLNDEPHDFRMTRSAVSQDDGFEQRRSPETIDVIDLNLCFQQRLDDRDVSTISRPDQPRAIVTVQAANIRARLERKF